MQRSRSTLIGLVLMVSACGGGGGSGGMPAPSGPPTGTPSPMPAPVGLAYGGYPEGLEVGTPFGPWQPTVSGGSASHYSVSPALPAGLSLDPTTGVLSGTPQAAAPLTTYVISTNIDGSSATFDLSLTVQIPPSGLTYSSPVQAAVGTALNPLSPVVRGNVDGYAIIPALPAGLQIDGVSGVLSGTPSSVRVPATYTISAYNNGGSSTSFDLLLAVDPPPTGTAMTGVFRDSTVIGLGYESGAHSGVTDSMGQFTYEAGHSITFRVGGIVLGTVPVSRPLLTPVDLVANGTGTSNYVLNVVRFLMMLDQDADPNNGIQISPAVTAAAAGWTAVDFNTSDLPRALGTIIQQVSTAEGVTHTLPDASTAQTHLRNTYYCAYSGIYRGTYAANTTPADHGSLSAEILPDGSMHAIAWPMPTDAGFDVLTPSALSPLLDATFVLGSQNPSVGIQGSLLDPTYLTGTYAADTAGTFEAARSESGDAVYQFVGTYLGKIDYSTDTARGFTALRMDAANHVTGRVWFDTIKGSVSGTTFSGTAQGHGHDLSTITGTFTRSNSGFTLSGQYDDGYQASVSFTTLGCRLN
jgi:hypothetical protein